MAMSPAVRAAMLMAVVSLSLGVGCDKQNASKTDAKTDTKTDTKTDAKPDSDEPPADEKATSFATPRTEPPPGPEGTITLPDPWLYVQTCAEPVPCPELLQPAGDAHCRELQIGGHVNFRLPSKDEVTRFRGLEQLEARAGYHWTRTPFDDDMGQAWIVDPEDPEGAPATTIPRDRKPFRIRCVKEP
jgi:hypothetical protein